MSLSPENDTRSNVSPVAITLPKAGAMLKPRDAVEVDATEAEHNTIFDNLVKVEGEVAGLVAYSIYKQNKRAWLHDFIKATGRPPNDAEFARLYHWREHRAAPGHLSPPGRGDARRAGSGRALVGRAGDASDAGSAGVLLRDLGGRAGRGRRPARLRPACWSGRRQIAGAPVSFAPRDGASALWR